LPLGVGHIRTKTHDYTRHGTVTLFAAPVLSRRQDLRPDRAAPTRTSNGWRSSSISTSSARHLALHLIVDNYATHKHPKVRSWTLAQTPASAAPTPQSASCCTSPRTSEFLDEPGSSASSATSRGRVREGSFTSVADLVRAIEAYLAARNLASQALRLESRGP